MERNAALVRREPEDTIEGEEGCPRSSSRGEEKTPSYKFWGKRISNVLRRRNAGGGFKRGVVCVQKGKRVEGLPYSKRGNSSVEDRGEDLRLL